MTTDAARNYVLDAFCPFVRLNASSAPADVTSMAEAKTLAVQSEAISRHAAELLAHPKRSWPSGKSKTVATQLASTFDKIAEVAHLAQSATTITEVRSDLQSGGGVDPDVLNEQLNQLDTTFNTDVGANSASTDCEGHDS